MYVNKRVKLAQRGIALQKNYGLLLLHINSEGAYVPCIYTYAR